MNALFMTAPIDLDRAALGILLAIVFDLLVRYIAFSQLESIAIDSAIFATMYNAIEVASSVGHEQTLWLQRGLLSLLFLCFLICVHRILQYRLGEQIAEYVDELHDHANDGEKNALTRASKMAVHTVLVTFLSPANTPASVRGGKKKRIREVVQYIRAVAPSVADDVTEDEFLLPKTERWFGAAAFLVLGVISVLTPFMNLG